MRKIVQIVVGEVLQPWYVHGSYSGPLYSSPSQLSVIFALCDDGTVMEKAFGEEVWRSTFLPEETVLEKPDVEATAK